MGRGLSSQQKETLTLLQERAVRRLEYFSNKEPLVLDGITFETPRFERITVNHILLLQHPHLKGIQEFRCPDSYSLRFSQAPFLNTLQSSLRRTLKRLENRGLVVNNEACISLTEEGFSLKL